MQDPFSRRLSSLRVRTQVADQPTQDSGEKENSSDDLNHPEDRGIFQEAALQFVTTDMPRGNRHKEPGMHEEDHRHLPQQKWESARSIPQQEGFHQRGIHKPNSDIQKLARPEVDRLLQNPQRRGNEADARQNIHLTRTTNSLHDYNEEARVDFEAQPFPNMSSLETFDEEDAQPVELRVFYSGAMSPRQYYSLRQKPGLYNIQLKARDPSIEKIEMWPARVALSDAVKHSVWIADHYNFLETQLMGSAWQTILTVETGLDVPQELLDAVITSLYTGHLIISPLDIQFCLTIASELKIACVTKCLLNYLQETLIPQQPYLYHLWGSSNLPDLGIPDLVEHHFGQIKWEGTMPAKMIEELARVLRATREDHALGLMRNLRRAPTMMPPMEYIKVCALLPERKRETLLEDLSQLELSMADVQSILHWANNRRGNRAILADSASLWDMIYSNSQRSFAPLEILKQRIGSTNAHLKLWDLPLIHILPDPRLASLPSALKYHTRRSGWLYLPNGRAFCMEAVYSRSNTGWGLFCTVDKQHRLDSGLIVRFFVLQQEGSKMKAKMSAALEPGSQQGLGSGIGFKNLLSSWTLDNTMIWKKNGDSYITVGLHIEEQTIAMSEKGNSQVSISAEPQLIVSTLPSDGFSTQMIRDTNSTKDTITESGISGHPKERCMSPEIERPRTGLRKDTVKLGPQTPPNFDMTGSKNDKGIRHNNPGHSDTEKEAEAHEKLAKSLNQGNLQSTESPSVTPNSLMDTWDRHGQTPPPGHSNEYRIVYRSVESGEEILLPCKGAFNPLFCTHRSTQGRNADKKENGKESRKKRLKSLLKGRLSGLRDCCSAEYQ